MLLVYTSIRGCFLNGIEGKIIRVETDISNGIPQFEIVGLPDTSVKESKDRVRSAIKNSGCEFLSRRITINLAPSNLPKAGSQLDLAIAVSILEASGQIGFEIMHTEEVYIGELSLDGRVCRVDGALPMALNIIEAGFDKIVLPLDNYQEVKVLEQKIKIIPVTRLNQLVRGEQKYSLYDMEPTESNTGYSASKEENLKLKNNDENQPDSLDLSDIKGQHLAKRALEIAAAGMHNVLLIGPPGTGKTMLAKSLPSIMPELTFDESMEVTKIYSASGNLNSNYQNGLITTPPVRIPHHTITEAALIGGGKIPRPGEISLAHRGVLVLDELSEFSQKILDLLRQPLEGGNVVIARSQTSCEFPAKFMLIATTNPCPCGYYTVPDKMCSCSRRQLTNHIGKLSGALWDRIDLQVEVPQIEYHELINRVENKKYSSDKVRQRVMAARDMQRFRYKETTLLNSMVNSNKIQEYCTLEKGAENLLYRMYSELGMSARGYDKILKIARTISDLDNRDTIIAADIAEAVSYRGLDRKY